MQLKWKMDILSGTQIYFLFIKKKENEFCLGKILHKNSLFPLGWRENPLK